MENRHFLTNEYGQYGDLSLFSLVYNKYGPILSVAEKAIVGNMNLASNRECSHGAIGGFMLTSLFTFLLICIRLSVQKKTCLIQIDSR